MSLLDSDHAQNVITQGSVYSGSYQDTSMYACAKEDHIMHIIDSTFLKHGETRADLEEKTYSFQANVGNGIYKFLTEFHSENNDPDCIKKHFTTKPITNMTREELEELSIEEIFTVCRDKIEWYKTEAYLKPFLKREKCNEKVEATFEEISSIINTYVRDRIMFVNNRAIFRVDYHYDQYLACDWPCIQRVAIEHLGLHAKNIQFSIIKRAIFDGPTQTASAHEGVMVASSTGLTPQSSTEENATRQDDNS